MRTEKFDLFHLLWELGLLFMIGTGAFSSLKEILPVLVSGEALTGIDKLNAVIAIFLFTMFIISAVRAGCMSFFNLIVKEED